MLSMSQQLCDGRVVQAALSQCMLSMNQQLCDGRVVQAALSQRMLSMSQQLRDGRVVQTALCQCMLSMSQQLCDGIDTVLFAQPYHHIVVGDLVEIFTALGIGKLADADAVRGMKLLHQEAAASLHNL